MNVKNDQYLLIDEEDFAIISVLSDEAIGRIFRALFEHARSGKNGESSTPATSGEIIAFEFLKKQLRRKG